VTFGRSKSYSDYYKDNSSTPGGSVDDEEENETPSGTPRFGMKKPKEDPLVAKNRKAALKRRLAKLRAGK
jgi:hypothetical protein